MTIANPSDSIEMMASKPNHACKENVLSGTNGAFGPTAVPNVTEVSEADQECALSVIQVTQVASDKLTRDSLATTSLAQCGVIGQHSLSAQQHAEEVAE